MADLPAVRHSQRPVNNTASPSQKRAFTFVLNTLIRMTGRSNLARVQSLFPPGLFSITQDTSWEEIFKTRKTQRISIMGKVRRVTRPCGRASHQRRLRGEK